ncbi:MAG: hypothetical protein K0V04_29360 [Deltaproteobacteria bacterium]|nr:hypothetical protein [Deltaproteobacteria bacterium]
MCLCNDGLLDGDDGDPTTTGASTGEPPAAQCGNGIVEAGEQCDDGNRDYEDACDNECIASCGPMWTVVVEGAVPAGLNPLAGDGVVDSQGRLVVTGTVDDAGDGGEIWIARRGPEGRDLWSHVVEGPNGADSGRAVAADADGNTLVVGHYWGDTAPDIWARKLDADGNTLWTMTHDDLGGMADMGTGAAFDADGNAIVVGTVTVTARDHDVWIRKLDPAGRELWTTTWSGLILGTSADEGGAVTTDADGNIYAFVREQTGDDEYQAVLLQFDADGGEPQWTYAPVSALPRPPMQRAVDVAVGPDGSLTMLTEMLDEEGTPSFHVGRVDATATPMWSYASDELRLGVPVRASGLGVDQDGGVGLVGAVFERPEQAFTLRLDPAGRPTCNRALAGDGGPLALTGGTVDSIGNMYAIGVAAGQPWLGRFRR